MNFTIGRLNATRSTRRPLVEATLRNGGQLPRVQPVGPQPRLGQTVAGRGICWLLVLFGGAVAVAFAAFAAVKSVGLLPGRLPAVWARH